jgi:hypothetical protein
MKILSIDVGIKNLALCLLEKNADVTSILYWNVLNITTTEEVVPPSKTLCSITPCTHPAKFAGGDTYYCTRHAKQCERHMPLDKPPAWKKLKVDDMTALATQWQVGLQGCANKTDTMQRLQQFHVEKFLQPYEQPASGATAVKDIDLVQLGINLVTILDRETDMAQHIPTLDAIVIENQISPIANRMKTIQGMLAQYFIMRGNPKVHFVSAANKLKGYDVSQDTYGDRKSASVQIVKDFLAKSAPNWSAFFASHKKNDDLADSFLQGQWYLNKK